MIKNLNVCETIQVLSNQFFWFDSPNNYWSLYNSGDKIVADYKDKIVIRVDVGQILMTIKDSFPSLAKLIYIPVRRFISNIGMICVDCNLMIYADTD